METPVSSKSGSSGSHSSGESCEKLHPMGFFAITVAVLAGALISGFAIYIGALMGGHKFSEFDLSPLVYFIGAFVCSIPLSAIIMVFWPMKAGRPVSKLLAVPLVFVPLAAWATGLCIPSIRHHQERLASERWQAANRRYVRYYEILRADPETALRERWFEGNQEQRETFRKSISDPNFEYSPALRAQLREIVPSLRHSRFSNEHDTETTEKGMLPEKTGQ